MLVVLVLPTAWIRTREHPSVPVGASLLSGLAASARPGLAHSARPESKDASELSRGRTFRTVYRT